MKTLFILFFKKKKLITELTQLFTKNAKNFNGLYKGFYQVAVDKNEKKVKALDEFYKRLSYLTDYEELIGILNVFFPTADQSFKRLVKLSSVILDAVNAANIYCSKKDEVITLTNENASDYQDWDGEDIFEGDTVKIVSPAWYQEGRLLEQGYCTLVCK